MSSKGSHGEAVCDEPVLSPNYVKISALMKAAGCDLGESECECVGHKLLSDCGFKQISGVRKQNTAEKEAQAEWKKPQKYATALSKNLANS